MTDTVNKRQTKALERRIAERQPSLRDRFAMAALTGLCAAMPRKEAVDIWGGIKGGAIEAEASYRLADAMLVARNNKEGK